MNNPSKATPGILFVDDEEMTRKTFERIASTEFPVLLAADVPSAIEMLKQRGDEIGVLLTDQRMPGQLGVELLEYAREHHPGIVRMLTTAYSELDDAIAAVNRGEIIRYISKPWDNIDALLIDLRVAMRFHQLEADNQALLEEKMSAKARGARIERIQSLVAIAASQAASSSALFGLEQILRQLSDLRGSDVVHTGSAEMYGGPVTEAKAAQTLGKCLSGSLPEREGARWSDLTRCPVEGNAASAEIPAWLGRRAGALVARMEALVMDKGCDQTRVVIDQAGEKLTVDFTCQGNGNASLASWVNGSTDTEVLSNLADLMALSFDLYAIGGNIRTEFSSAGELTRLRADVPLENNEKPVYKQDDDWLEDVIILFA